MKAENKMTAAQNWSWDVHIASKAKNRPGHKNKQRRISLAVISTYTTLPTRTPTDVTDFDKDDTPLSEGTVVVFKIFKQDKKSISTYPVKRVSNSSGWSPKNSFLLDSVKVLKVDNRIVCTLEVGLGGDREERIVAFESVSAVHDFVKRISILKKKEMRRREIHLSKTLLKTGAKPDDRIRLYVNICGAQGLSIGDMFSSDPYCVVRMRDKELHRTKYILKTLNPVWTPKHNSLFELSISYNKFFTRSEGITFEVRDYDALKTGDSLGSFLLSQERILNSSGKEENVVLRKTDNVLERTTSTLTLKIKVESTLHSSKKRANEKVTGPSMEDEVKLEAEPESTEIGINTEEVSPGREVKANYPLPAEQDPILLVSYDSKSEDEEECINDPILDKQMLAKQDHNVLSSENIDLQKEQTGRFDKNNICVSGPGSHTNPFDEPYLGTPDSSKGTDLKRQVHAATLPREQDTIFGTSLKSGDHKSTDLAKKETVDKIEKNSNENEDATRTQKLDSHRDAEAQKIAPSGKIEIPCESTTQTDNRVSLESVTPKKSNTAFAATFCGSQKVVPSGDPINNNIGQDPKIAVAGVITHDVELAISPQETSPQIVIGTELSENEIIEARNPAVKYGIYCACILVLIIVIALVITVLLKHHQDVTSTTFPTTSPIMSSYTVFTKEEHFDSLEALFY